MFRNMIDGDLVVQEAKASTAMVLYNHPRILLFHQQKKVSHQIILVVINIWNAIPDCMWETNLVTN